jgi:hypothetical protein
MAYLWFTENKEYGVCCEGQEMMFVELTQDELDEYVDCCLDTEVLKGKEILVFDDGKLTSFKFPSSK